MTKFLILCKSNILWKLNLQQVTGFMLEEEFVSSKCCQDKLANFNIWRSCCMDAGFQRAGYQFRLPNKYYVMFTPSIKQLK